MEKINVNITVGNISKTIKIEKDWFYDNAVEVVIQVIKNDNDEIINFYTALK